MIPIMKNTTLRTTPFTIRELEVVIDVSAVVAAVRRCRLSVPCVGISGRKPRGTCRNRQHYGCSCTSQRHYREPSYRINGL